MVPELMPDPEPDSGDPEETDYFEETLEEEPTDLAAVEEEVREVRDAVSAAASDSNLADKVYALSNAIDQVTREVAGLRGVPKGPDIETFQALRSQVSEVRTEWESLNAGLQAQRDRLDTLLQSFPGAVEVSAVRALALRVSHLEALVGELMEGQRARSASRVARAQMLISIAALAVTIVLWAVWILTS